MAYYSRFKEFRADKTGSTLVGKEKMIAFRELRLRKNGERLSQRNKILALFATHPSYKEQIKKLQAEFPQ